VGEQSRKIIFIVGLAILIVGGSFYSFWQKSSVNDSITAGEALAKGTKEQKEREEKSSEIMVYISGAVYRPGVFKVHHNARIIDVVNLAGGLSLEADVTKINMAQLVKDGMHIHVVAKPTVNSSGGSSPSDTGKVATSGGKGQGIVNINTADKNALDALPGIGPALAERIVEYRQNNGTFSEIEGLRKVPGVGASKFEKLKDKITI
jgi:competence protein ComEA